MIWPFRPKHTLLSVAKEIIEGLENGSVVLPWSPTEPMANGMAADSPIALTSAIQNLKEKFQLLESHSSDLMKEFYETNELASSETPPSSDINDRVAEAAVTVPFGSYGDEHTWLVNSDPIVLLDFLFPHKSEGSIEHQTRKCRCYLLECARRQWDRLPSVCRAIVALSEVFAEDPRKEARLRAQVAPIAEQLMNSAGEEDDLREAALALRSTGEEDVPGGVLSRLDPRDRSVSTAGAPAEPFTEAEWRGLAALVYLPFFTHTPPFTWVPRELHSIELLREIYHNPYLFIPFKPEWRTANVLALAQGMYDTRDFSAMPILADALEDAGCDNADVLEHCRGPGPHVRGCWVLDIVLNRK